MRQKNLFDDWWTLARHHIWDRQGPGADLTNVTFPNDSLRYLHRVLHCPDGSSACCERLKLSLCVSVCMCFIWLMGIFGRAVCPCIRSVITAIKETRGNGNDKQLAINDTSSQRCNNFPIHQSSSLHTSLSLSAIRLPAPARLTTAFLSGEELLGRTKGLIELGHNLMFISNETVVSSTNLWHRNASSRDYRHMINYNMISQLNMFSLF